MIPRLATAARPGTLLVDENPTRFYRTSAVDILNQARPVVQLPEKDTHNVRKTKIFQNLAHHTSTAESYCTCSTMYRKRRYGELLFELPGNLRGSFADVGRMEPHGTQVPSASLPVDLDCASVTVDARGQWRSD